MFEPLLHAFVAILNVLVGLIGRRVYLCDLCTAKTPTSGLSLLETLLPTDLKSHHFWIGSPAFTMGET